jgi:diacylglycerol kinase family enzyme
MARYRRMTGAQRIWLVLNEASGSNDEEAHEHLSRRCGGAGFRVERTVRFPDEALPAPAALDAAGVALVAVFAGDGTVNALVTALAGWSGAVLVLPGGTMNLLFHRLHGERELDEVIALAAAGRAKATRPGVIASRAGTALAELLAGPGTGWYDVREAMREGDVPALAAGAASALGETLAAPGIRCRDPALGRTEGYPLVMLTPTDDGIAVAGFYAETPGEFLQGGWAVVRHRFREGPHDELGTVRQIALASTAGEPFGLLLDGEKAESGEEAVFRLVPCAVDLLATVTDGR